MRPPSETTGPARILSTVQPNQPKAVVGTFADAAVVGSALVSVIEGSKGRDDLPARLRDYVQWLKGSNEERRCQ